MATLHQPNDTINQRYRIVTPLGQGSMGTTYEAEDLTNYQRVAIKAVSLRQATDWKILELFEREGRVLANLDHPQIPNYLDYFEIETDSEVRFYLVQELVQGESLATLVEKNWHPDEDTVKDIGIQILKILEYLHSFSPPVIHRDIKPQNIIRLPDGRVYLVDFGAVQDVYRNTMTRGGTFVGTLGYMPLEQFRGQVKPASDLYSLGATLLFLLTGKSPADLPQVMMKIDWRSQVNISDNFSSWLEKTIEPALEDRFSSAKEALNALSFPKLEKRNVSVFQPKNPPPRGSNITVEIKSDRAFIYIPPKQWGVNLAVVAIATAALGALIFLFQSIAGGYWGASIILIIFGFFVLVFPLAMLEAICHSIRIEINRETFEIEVNFLGFKKKVVRGKTIDMEKVEIQTIETPKASKGSDIIVIWEGIRRKVLSIDNLSLDVKYWLVEEISHIMELMQPPFN